MRSRQEAESEWNFIQYQSGLLADMKLQLNDIKFLTQIKQKKKRINITMAHHTKMCARENKDLIKIHNFQWKHFQYCKFLTKKKGK